MKKIVYTILLLTMGFALNSKADTNTNSTFLDHTSVTLEEEFRFKEGDFYYEHTDISGKYKFNDHVDVFGGYRLILQDKGLGFKDQSMFIPGFNLKTSDSKYGKLTLRSRVEIGLNTSPTPTSYQLTEYLKYNTPWKLTKFKINPFIGDETFFDCSHQMDFNKNRAYAGLDYQFTKKIKGSTYYFRESNKKNNNWTDSNVVVTQVKFEF